jgi:N-formylmaleamate deformylase
MTDATARAVYAAQRIGGRLALGTRPAVLVVDLQTGFTDAAGPAGADLSDCVLATRRLLDAARAARRTVLFTRIAYDDPREAGIWLQKMPGLAGLLTGSRWIELDPRLGRRDDEPIVSKRGASALWATDTADRLAGADTVVLCGATTSGCVRASAVDLLQAGFPVVIPRECVGDRTRAPHEANLFDLDAKYADVVALERAIGILTSHPKEDP